MYEITRINAGANCYLVTQKDATILVDTGVKGFEKKILSQCEGKQVKLIVLTHGHIDHAQNAAFLAKQLQVPIAMSKKDIPLLTARLSQNFFHVKVVDEAKITIDFAAFQNDLSERGEFVREVGRYAMNEEDRAEILDVGLKALAGEEIDL